MLPKTRKEIMNAVRDYIEAIPQSITLYDIDLTPTKSHVYPTEVDLKTTIGPVILKIPLLSSPMDTTTGARLAKALSVMGGCGILFRHPDPAEQLAWLADVLSYQWCVVKEPECLYETSSIGEAERVLKQKGFSTIPVKNAEKRLTGVLFTRDVAFKWHREDAVSRWMTPLEKLKTTFVGTQFSEIRDRLLHEQECSVLPIVDDEAHLHGIYFMKDVVHADPSEHGGKPLVGIAINTEEGDLDRALEAMRMGAGIIHINTSHGDSRDVIEQVNRLCTIAAPFTNVAIMAGNIADVDGGGYMRLAEAGVHAVTVGIGSGSICTTTGQTGAGVGMVTAIRACVEGRKKSNVQPAIIADGGINEPGDAVKALLVGADAVMCGKWFVAASESRSAIENGIHDGKVLYRGMASREAIAERVSDRYDRKKTAPEGVTGWVPHRGPLMQWLPEDLELVRGGFAHAGASNIEALHQYGNKSGSSNRFTSLGRMQAAVRVEIA